MWCVKFAINIKMCSGAIRVHLGGAVVSTAPPKCYYLISMRNVDAGSCALFTRLARVKGCHP